MKILLIQPDYFRQAQDPGQLESRLLPSYSLILLAEIMERAGHQTRVLDSWANWVITGKGVENNLETGLKAILAKEQFDLIGISIDTAARKEAIGLAKIARELNPSAKIVAGGPHPTRFWSALLTEYRDLIDFAFLGGADESLPALVAHLSGAGGSLDTIAGIAYRNELGEAVATSKPMFNLNLEKQPALNFKSYFSSLDGARPNRAYMVSTRGCKYFCNFCSQVWKKALFHPVARVVEEARILIEDHGVSELVFYDDCLGLSGKHSADIFMAIAGFKSKARLTGVSHIQLLNPLWLNAFKEAGGSALMLGIESGTLKLRRKMNKYIEDKELCMGVELVRKMGLKLGIYTMIGYPTEEINVVNYTRRLFEKISPEQVIATVYDLKPGDIMIEWGLKGLMIQESDFFNLDRRFINYMSESELEEAVGMADYFETKFTSQELLKDHDPAWWLLGMDSAKRESLRLKAEENLAKCQR